MEAARLFEVPAGGPYLLTHSVGPLPVGARSVAQSAYFQPWSDQGGDAWPLWLNGIGRFCAALAALFGGQAAHYCPQSNVSSGLSKLLPALPRRDPRRRILLAAEDAFPSVGYVLKMAERSGFELRLIPREQDPAEAETWERALSDRVFAALVTHVHSNTGVASPVRDIAGLCAARGIYSVVDVCQSAGLLPIQVESCGADAFIGSCVKWLCGGPGAGFMWLRPALLPELNPIDVGWFSHENPFEMDIRAFRYADDARRFWGGTPSVLPYLVAAEGLALIAKLKVESILAHNRALMSAFLERLSASMRPQISFERCGGTLCLPLESGFESTVAALKQAGARFDTRGKVVRLSFHACNSLDDAVSMANLWPRARSSS